MEFEEKLSVQAVQWMNSALGSLKVLDQRKLPAVIKYDEYLDAAGVAEAIRTMRVRGAPAIGIAAAYAVFLSVRQRLSTCPDQWRQAVDDDIRVLASSRPTAVNLFWALDRMKKELENNLKDPLPGLLNLAREIHHDDIKDNRKMGQMGAEILGDAEGVLTHCNAGALATGGYGTALGVIRSAYANGLKSIYATETRPWLQGARLTVWELQQDGIPATLITDSAAAFLMKSGKIDWVIVGADRIALNGDVANKIGTYSLAVNARHHGVKVMVVAPTSTIDWQMENGEGIEIEQRNSGEILDEIYLRKNSLVSAWNPVFDVTPAELISAIVTERGVVLKPAEEGVRSLRPLS